ncbi:acyl-CoA dehydrogenase NM domain-like protein [Abortiporus biennis]|nr:acyl-CoA dehydrogenase NM domain-like protein [Abortiporus biennis]
MASMSLPKSLAVLNNGPFTIPSYTLPTAERAAVAYKKAELSSLTYQITMNDVLHLSPKFFELHLDPVAVLDTAIIALVTIQYNLCAGTIARYAINRPELVPLVDDLLQWRKHGQYFITEVGHGVDMSNLETTATCLPSGEFILHSPTPQSHKHMPPTIPAGKPTIGIVFAKLTVNNEDRGIRPFIVPINDGRQMCTGVTAQLLPNRGDVHPVNHGFTAFNQVRLPASALLGSLDKPRSAKDNMLDITWRVAIGTIAVACLAVPFMKCCATIGAKFSLRRRVGPPGNTRPIIQFRTQQIPVLTAISQVYVLQSYAQLSTNIFRDTDLDIRIRHGIATILKAVMTQLCFSSARLISDRCGAQGLYEHNQMNVLFGTMRGVAIAEGEVLALSIRLATELLQGRYNVPTPLNHTSILARHEAGLLSEYRAILKSSPGHRSEQVNKFIIPQCLPLVEAIGHRMAYEAAVADKLPSYIIDLYVASIIKLDPAWYVEHANISRQDIFEMESKALDEMLPHVERLVDDMGMEPYVSAPIVSDEKWDAFIESLPVVAGSGRVNLWDTDVCDGEHHRYHVNARL